MACSTCFLIHPKTTCLGVASPTVFCTLPHPSLIKKIAHKLAYRPLWWGCFSVGVPSSQMTLACIDKNNKNLDSVGGSGIHKSRVFEQRPYSCHEELEGIVSNSCLFCILRNQQLLGNWITGKRWPARRAKMNQCLIDTEYYCTGLNSLLPLLSWLVVLVIVLVLVIVHTKF